MMNNEEKIKYLKKEINALEKEMKNCKREKDMSFIYAMIGRYKKEIEELQAQIDDMPRIDEKIKELQNELKSCKNAKDRTFIMATINIYSKKLGRKVPYYIG